jgi:hypothetical protein
MPILRQDELVKDLLSNLVLLIPPLGVMIAGVFFISGAVKVCFEVSLLWLGVRFVHG